MGYRLVLPPHSLTAPPQIAPAPDASGALRCWRLDPFQLPDDIRLRDGHLYRILWVDEHGDPIPPPGTRQLPALHFFLGPPDPRSARQQRQDEATLLNISDPAERSRQEAELARLRIEALKARQQHRQWKREWARAEAELRHNAAKHKLLSQQLRKVQEANERALAQQREQAAKQAAEQEKKSTRDALITLGIVTGFPIVAAALVALIKKLQGQEIVWPALWDSVQSTFNERADALGLSAQSGEKAPAAASSPARTPVAAPAAATTPDRPSLAAPTAASAPNRAPPPATPSAASAAAAHAAPSPPSRTPIPAPALAAAAAAMPAAPSAPDRGPHQAPALAAESSAPLFPPSILAPTTSVPMLATSLEEGGTPSPVALRAPVEANVPASSASCPVDSTGVDQPLSPDEQALVNRVISDPKGLAALGYELLCVLSPQWTAAEPAAQALRQLGEEQRHAVRQLVDRPRLLDYVARSYTARFGEPWPFPSPSPATPMGTPAPATPHADASPERNRASGGVPDRKPEPALPSGAQNTPLGVSEQAGESSPADRQPSPPTAEALADPNPIRLFPLGVARTAPLQFDPPLTEQEERTLCALVLDPEMRAQLRFEQRAAQDRAEGKPVPVEPITEITAAERDRLRRVAADASVLEVLPCFERVFRDACQHGAQAVFNLPAPFRSLRNSDKKWLDQVRFIPDRAVYLEYLQQHQQALLHGQPVPREPEHRLTAKQRQLLKQVARDLRVRVYLEQTEALRAVAPRETGPTEAEDAAPGEPSEQVTAQCD